ncbi:MAG: Uncharacterized UPF0721 integral membrane protein, partial [uncultured Acidimicrobiales bacterium]
DPRYGPARGGRRLRRRLDQRRGRRWLARVVPGARRRRPPAPRRQRHEHGVRVARLPRERRCLPRRGAGPAAPGRGARGHCRSRRRRGLGRPAAGSGCGLRGRRPGARPRGLRPPRGAAEGGRTPRRQDRSRRPEPHHGRPPRHLRGGGLRRVLRRRAGRDPAGGARHLPHRPPPAHQRAEVCALAGHQHRGPGGVRLVRPCRLGVRRRGRTRQPPRRLPGRGVRPPPGRHHAAVDRDRLRRRRRRLARRAL